MTTSAENGLKSLSVELDALRQAVAARDTSEEWRLTRNVLSWLHYLDEVALKRLGKAAYHETLRPQTPDGRTQAALMLLRAIAQHHGPEVQTLVWRPVQVRTGAGLRMTVSLGGGEPVEVRTAITEWPALADLPSSRDKAYGRDVFYAQHVQGKTLLEPLEAAQRFLVATLQ